MGGVGYTSGKNRAQLKITVWRRFRCLSEFGATLGELFLRDNMMLKRTAAILLMSWSIVGFSQDIDNKKFFQNKEALPAEYTISSTQKRAYRLAKNLLENHHYRRLSTKEMAQEIQDDFLNALDPSHLYFLQSDVEEFANRLAQNEGRDAQDDLSLPIDIFRRYQQRSRALNDWTLARLNQPFDFGSSESVTYPDEKTRKMLPWLADEQAAKAQQEKRLLDQIIHLKLAGRSTEKAIETLSKRYKSTQKQLDKSKVSDVFDSYMNVMASRFDPHTGYLSPKMSENFDINMRLSLEGIGAVLGLKDDKITVREVITGGPAAKTGKLFIKDQIIGVAQGTDGEMVDVVGWRTDEAIELIRGKKGSLVRLLVEPANAAKGVHEVVIQRDTVALEEQAAHAYVEQIDGHKIGVIKLPSFYMDFNGARSGKSDFRSTSEDVKKLVQELQAQKVQGIVLDLRNNGGGSLYEAVKTVGLFIDKGPVVSIAQPNKKARAELDDEAGMVYDGPLAVMINHYSASASEIFAAAIQDYQRGIIIGRNSYGKGTVQTMTDLNRFVSKDVAPLGYVKHTIAMFHRVNGDSTQKKGVQADITLPEGLGIDKVGEMAEEYALPWKSIAAEKFIKDGRVKEPLLTYLRDQHKQRMDTLPALLRYSDYMNKVAERNEQQTWSLNFKEREAQFKQWKDFQDAYNESQQQALPKLASDEKVLEQVKKSNEFVEDEADKIDFVPDIDLFEALNVMQDYIQWLIHEQLQEAA